MNNYEIMMNGNVKIEVLYIIFVKKGVVVKC